MIKHFVGGDWIDGGEGSLPLFDPASGRIIDEVPLGGAVEVELAAQAAASAWSGWADVPIMERVELMHRFKFLLESHTEELARIVTSHHGKTLEEARGEVRRGIEVVDFACGAPTLLQGRTLRQVSRGLDQDLYRYPLGVVVGITPFNFPVMIPLWMFPLAVIAGNTFILKASERTPLGAVRLAELFADAGFPKGVLNVVHGARDAAEMLCRHPEVAGVSFVGSEPAARSIYEEASRHGKRVQAAGGAKNHIIVLPDADLELAVPAIMNSAFGNAGERCLAGSVAVGVGGIAEELVDKVSLGAARLVVGPGNEEGTDVGPLIRDEHRNGVLAYLERGVIDGGELVVDGRDQLGRPGFFLGPSVLAGVSPEMAAGREEIFGPVLAMSQVDSLEEGVDQANQVTFGNMAVVFTRSGRSARVFRETVLAGMIGVNVAVAQPFGFYPFSGWRGSFYGDLHLQGTDGVDFYTRKKVVVSRW